MSSSIAIPKRKDYNTLGDKSKTATSASSSSSSYSQSPQTPGKLTSMSSSTSTPDSAHYRRPSLLSSSFSQSEHTVIDIGDPNGVPRLITCVKASQGFEWNPEIFLPSYIETDFESLDRKREPVHEIMITDEEAEMMFPK